MTRTEHLTLAQALAGLLEAARAAGIPEDQARAEGEGLAAMVSEPAAGAWLDWSAQTGGDRSAEEFTLAASRARRWRAGPTPGLAVLISAGHPQAPGYAAALAAVCAAGGTLGTTTPRVLANASATAAAQLAALTPNAPAGGTEPGAGRSVVDEAAARSERSRAALTDFSATAGALWSDVMAQLGAVREKLRQTPGPAGAPGPAGSPFDLGDADPWGPGAFPGLGPTPVPPPTAPPLGGEGSTAGEAGGIPARTAPAKEAPAEPEPPAKTLEELLAELDALIGLAGVKREVHQQVALLQVEAKRRAAGLRTPGMTRHLIFVGNPGTGKTTVARLLGGIYRALGLLKTGQLVEVDRSELVAGYLGQTAIKTSDVVKSALGGVLFIDEAYSLTGDQYAQEAVDTLVKEMEDHRDDLVVVVAGYPLPMAEFIAGNPGLASRFRTTIGFEDYSDDELVAILRSMAADADYDITDEVEQAFRGLLGEQERGPLFGNGRFARNVLEGAIGRHAWRLRDVADPSVADLRTLLPEDLRDPTETVDIDSGGRP